MLAVIALLIGWEAVGRLFDPVPIAFASAIPIAACGSVPDESVMTAESRYG